MQSLGAHQAVAPSDLDLEEASLVRAGIRAAATRLLRSRQVRGDSREAKPEGVALNWIRTGTGGGVKADDWSPGLGIWVDGGATHTEVT